jgi:hypothetical protein
MNWHCECCECEHRWTEVDVPELSDPDSEGVVCPECHSDLIDALVA